MSRRTQRPPSVVDAPDEQGFVPDESPEPGPVATDTRRARARSVHDGESRGARVCRSIWSGIKLASGVLMVVCASVAVAWGAHHYALTTPRFAVRQLEIDGNRRINDAEVIERSGIQVGANIFSLELANAERRLLEDPWIKEASVTRRLPGTLEISLAEREAAAVASLDGRLYLVTPSGEPFKQVQPGDPFDLPVITGVALGQLAGDRNLAVERLTVALSVLRHYQRVPIQSAFPPQEVHLTDGGAVVLTVGKQGITLHLGRGPFKKKLLMGARVVGKLRQKGQTPGIIFLDNRAHPERVVVRMR